MKKNGNNNEISDGDMELVYCLLSTVWKEYQTIENVC